MEAVVEAPQNYAGIVEWLKRAAPKDPGSLAPQNSGRQSTNTKNRAEASAGVERGSSAGPSNSSDWGPEKQHASAAVIRGRSWVRVHLATL